MMIKKYQSHADVISALPGAGLSIFESGCRLEADPVVEPDLRPELGKNVEYWRRLESVSLDGFERWKQLLRKPGSLVVLRVNAEDMANVVWVRSAVREMYSPRGVFQEGIKKTSTLLNNLSPWCRLPGGKPRIAWRCVENYVIVETSEVNDWYNDMAVDLCKHLQACGRMQPEQRRMMLYVLMIAPFHFLINTGAEIERISLLDECFSLKRWGTILESYYRRAIRKKSALQVMVRMYQLNFYRTKRLLVQGRLNDSGFESDALDLLNGRIYPQSEAEESGEFADFLEAIRFQDASFLNLGNYRGNDVPNGQDGFSHPEDQEADFIVLQTDGTHCISFAVRCQGSWIVVMPHDVELTTLSRRLTPEDTMRIGLTSVQFPGEWDKVNIELGDGSVVFNTSSGEWTVTYKELGFFDGRNQKGKLTADGDLFEKIPKEKSKALICSGAEKEQGKKTISRLRKRLKQLFMANVDPLPAVKGAGERKKIAPEAQDDDLVFRVAFKAAGKISKPDVVLPIRGVGQKIIRHVM